MKEKKTGPTDIQRREKEQQVMGDISEGVWKEAGFKMFLEGWIGFLELEKGRSWG